MNTKLTTQERLEKLKKENELARIKKLNKAKNKKRREKRQAKTKVLNRIKKKENTKLLNSKKYLPIEETKKWFKNVSQKYDITSHSKWHNIIKEYDIPKNIPKYLHIAYKGKYSSIGDFFHKPIRIYLTYDAAKKYLFQFNLTSYSVWREWYIINKPKFIPSEPRRFYMDYGWISWNDFLGNDKEYNFVSYNEAIKWVHKLKLTSMIQWNTMCVEGKIPKNIPHRPESYYEEWHSWGFWLGKTLSDKLNIQEQNTSIIFILHQENYPSNVYTIGIEKDGIIELEKWTKINNFKIYKLYNFEIGKGEILNHILDNNCSPWEENLNNNEYLVPNIFSLTCDLEYIFKPVKIV